MLRRVREFVRSYIEDKHKYLFNSCVKDLFNSGVQEMFDLSVQEKVCRQAFFYNAFMALTFNGIDGDYAEFGSCGGMTFVLAYRESRRHKHNANFWAFDSFKGLPAPKGEKDSHPVWEEGAMSTSVDQFHDICASNGIPRRDYHVVPGFYEETLTSMSPTDEPKNIALAYIDCDLYSSAQKVLEFLMPRLKHGMIIAFDDYFCWSPAQISGERRAKLEFFSNHSTWELIPFMRFGWHGNSFVVENRKISGA
jgi:O-methyltransferase